ncbi:unnamed protein product [Timema podura]|uniref:LIM zinc-binding domain-containing protein n=1 Tax=Timema podura TaxID=61482 RepID=A0ABN7NK03_TIMPD|nr:unnamed protein product [Timema podura]
MKYTLISSPGRERLFGNTGHCAACSKVIPAFEMVMRARNNVYHLECFACQQCNHSDRLFTGDKGLRPCAYDIRPLPHPGEPLRLM